MANNRMYLVHRPTGKTVYLAKRMALGWYNVPSDLAERVEKLFAATELDGQDDFIIALEDAKDAPACTDKWKYGESRDEIIIDRPN